MTVGSAAGLTRGRVTLNVTANYAAKLWSIVSVYVFVPLYVKLLGVGAYGLIAFYSVALAILFVADAGISATFGREAAYEQNQKRLRDLLKSLEAVLFGIVGLTGVGFFLCAKLIALHWLNTGGTIAQDVAVDSLRMMAGALVPQIAMSLYSGGLMGLQRQVHANVLTILFGLIRSGLVILPIYFLPDVRVYFAWQVVSSWVFVILVRHTLRRALRTDQEDNGRFSWDVLKPMLPYAAGMFAMAIIAGLNNQLDRLVVSKYLPLRDFTFYSLAAMISQIPAILTAPVATAIAPRFVELQQKSELARLREMYEKYTFAIAALGSAACFGLFFFGGEVVAVWLHGQNTPQYMTLVIQILAVGSLFLALQLTPYYLSLANGHTRTNVRLGLFALIVTVPAQVALTRSYGAVGSAVPWLCINVCAFFYLGVSLNRKFNSRHIRTWFACCTLPPVLLSGAIFAIGRVASRAVDAPPLGAIGVGFVSGLLSLLASTVLWTYIKRLLRHQD